MVAAFVGAVLSSGYDDQVSGDYSFVDSPYGDVGWVEDVIIKGTGNGSFRAEAGYIYMIEIAGANGNSVGAPGGKGAVVTGWFESSSTTNYNYSVGMVGEVSIGGTGIASGGSGYAGLYRGGGGGAASGLSLGGTVLMVAGGGGGSGGGTAPGGNAGYVVVNGDTSIGTIYNGEPGAGIGGAGGTNVGGSGVKGAGGAGGNPSPPSPITPANNGAAGLNGGGGGGSQQGGSTTGGGGGGGYAGGQGGGGGNAANAGGGGGGSSFIRNSVEPDLTDPARLKTNSESNNGWITVKKYVIPIHATIEADAIEYVYSGIKQDITPYATVPEANPLYPPILTFLYSDSPTGPWDSEQPTDAGTYYVHISFNDPRYYGDPEVVELKITPKLLPKPTAVDNRVPYDNAHVVHLTLNDFIDDEDIMTISGHMESEVGSYTATITLVDTNNYRWEDGSIDDVHVYIQWSILESRSVTGRVTFWNLNDLSDPLNGEPLEGVHISYSINDGENPETLWVAEYPTDSNGEYTVVFVSGDEITIHGGLKYGYLITNPDQGLPRTFTENTTSPDGDFTMGYNPLEDFVVSGKVIIWDDMYGTDETNGTPIWGAIITYAITTNGVHTEDTLTTGPEGEYEIIAPAGSVVEIISATHTGFKPLDGPLWNGLMNEDHPNVDIQMTYLAPYRTLYGNVTLTDKDGVPILSGTDPIPLEGVRIDFEVWLATDPDPDTGEYELVGTGPIRYGYRITDADGYYEIITTADEGGEYFSAVVIVGVTKEGYLVNEDIPDPVLMDQDMGDPKTEDFSMRETYIVMFDPLNGVSPWPVIADAGGTVDEPTYTPARAGYTFGGWEYPMGSATLWNFSNTVLTGGMTLFAIWELDPEVYRVTVNVTNLGWSGMSTVEEYDPLTIEFDAYPGFNLPSTIIVEMGGTTLTEGVEYDWNDSTGVLEIFEVTGDVVITAAGETTDWVVKFSAVNTTGGSITATAGGTPIVTNTPIPADEDVYFTAAPLSGWRVKEWTLNGAPVMGNTSNTYTYEDLDQNIEVKVEFERITYEVTYNAIGGTILAQVLGGNVFSSGDLIIEGRNLRFTAIPNTGWHVKEWKVNGTHHSAVGLDLDWNNLSEDLFVEVEFELVYQVSFSVVGLGGTILASVNGGPSTVAEVHPPAGSEIVFTATPTVGWQVKEWRANGVPVAGNKTNTFTHSGLSAPLVVTVEFEIIYHVNFSVVNGTGGTLSAEVDGSPIVTGGMMVAGKDIEFTAVQQPSWYVKEWFVNGTALGITTDIYTHFDLSMNLNVMVEFEEESYTISGTVTGQNDGLPLESVRITYNVGGPNLYVYTDAAGEYSITAYVSKDVTITAIGLTGWVPAAGTVLPAGPFNGDMADIDFVMALSPPSGSKDYYITASSDSMTVISPQGTVTVSGGTNRTFYFSAKEGYHVDSVTVDGKNLSQTEIDLGYFTFANVNANHTIKVLGGTGSKETVTLWIDVKEGSGNVQYSTDGAPFQPYTGPISVLPNSSVIVRAYADNGYKFEEWRDGGSLIATPEYTIYGLSGDVKEIEVYFVDAIPDPDSNLLWWIVIAALLLIVAGLLLWFILFYRRYYDVIKEEGPVKIIGNDRVHRKSEYRFSVERGYPGIVSYRIGEDGKWEPLLPTPEGEYVIPKGLIIDDVTIKYS